jgi:hypothetical protein
MSTNLAHVNTTLTTTVARVVEATLSGTALASAVTDVSTNLAHVNTTLSTTVARVEATLSTALASAVTDVSTNLAHVNTTLSTTVDRIEKTVTTNTVNLGNVSTRVMATEDLLQHNTTTVLVTEVTGEMKGALAVLSEVVQETRSELNLAPIPTTPTPDPGDAAYCTPWSTWTDCTTFCGSGTQSRGRTSSQPTVQVCPGTLTESKSCNTHPCVVDCAVSDWGAWSTNCSNTSCAATKRWRVREVVTPMVGRPARIC